MFSYMSPLYISTLKPRYNEPLYNEPRYSEFRDIVNKPSAHFEDLSTKHNTFDIVTYSV